MLDRLGVAHVSLLIATLSGAMAIYQGYIGTRNLEIVQRDIGRREQLRACKDVIEAYFEANLRIRRAAATARAADVAPAERRSTAFEAEQAAARFAAVATYLANLEGEAVRALYTELARALTAAATRAAAGETADVDALEARFATLNQDCVRSGRTASTGPGQGTPWAA